MNVIMIGLCVLGFKKYFSEKIALRGFRLKELKNQALLKILNGSFRFQFL